MSSSADYTNDANRREAMRGGSLKTMALALGTGVLLSLGAVAQNAATTSGVTLVNQSNHAIKVFAKYGSDGSCESQPQMSEINIAPGESQSVDTPTKACICLQVPERNTCPTGWESIKVGAKRIYR
jgi:hypothetical protein